MQQPAANHCHSLWGYLEVSVSPVRVLCAWMSPSGSENKHWQPLLPGWRFSVCPLPLAGSLRGFRCSKMNSPAWGTGWDCPKWAVWASILPLYTAARTWREAVSIVLAVTLHPQPSPGGTSKSWSSAWCGVKDSTDRNKVCFLMPNHGTDLNDLWIPVDSTSFFYFVLIIPSS